MINIGILGLQGAIEEHRKALNNAQLGLPFEINLVSVQQISDTKNLSGIVFPGGESTAMIKQGEASGLFNRLRELINDGLPAFGTCAGLILLSKRVKRTEGSEETKGIFSVLDVLTLRNGYGRQKDSFTTKLVIPDLGNKEIEGVFIRAPVISEIGNNVKVLSKTRGNPVFVQQGNIIATTFHPELSGSPEIHVYFLTLAQIYNDSSK